MDDSERLERFKQYICRCDENDGDLEKKDQELAERILLLLNDPKIDKYCMVDAYYYDFSVIPRDVQQKLQLWRDAYLIYGINVEGEIISKWVDRWDLDSSDPIVNGEVIRPTFDALKSGKVPEINIKFNPNLLSTPTPDLKIFDKNG